MQVKLWFLEHMSQNGHIYALGKVTLLLYLTYGFWKHRFGRYTDPGYQLWKLPTIADDGWYRLNFHERQTTLFTKTLLFNSLTQSVYIIVQIWIKIPQFALLISVSLFISQETQGLYLIIREKITSYFSRHISIYAIGQTESHRTFKQEATHVATIDQLEITKFCPKQ